MTARAGTYARLVLAAVLLLVCAVALTNRVDHPVESGCAATCPVESIVARTADAAGTAVPCLRDPACGGATAGAFAFVLVAVLGLGTIAGPAPLAVARRPHRNRVTTCRGAYGPLLRPPIAG